jgi:hypothetical protein
MIEGQRPSDGQRLCEDSLDSRVTGTQSSARVSSQGAGLSFYRRGAWDSTCVVHCFKARHPCQLVSVCTTTALCIKSAKPLTGTERVPTQISYRNAGVSRRGYRYRCRGIDVDIDKYSKHSALVAAFCGCGSAAV